MVDAGSTSKNPGTVNSAGVSPNSASMSSASTSNGKSGSANQDTSVGMSESSGEVEISPRNKVNARLLTFVVAHIKMSSHLLGVTI